MNPVHVLYLENSGEVIEAFENYFEDRVDFDIVDNVVAFDHFLFSAHESYDFVIVDLSVSMKETPLEVVHEKIDEFKDKVIPTKVRGALPLIGYDYIKHVMQNRQKTLKMINEGRVAAISGHAESIKKEGLYTDEVFKGIPFFDRAYSPVSDIDRLIQKAVRRYYR